MLPERRIYTTDFLLFRSWSDNPIERAVTWYANRCLRRALSSQTLNLYLDEPDWPSNREKEVLRSYFRVVGPVVERPCETPRDENASAWWNTFAVFPT